MMTTPDLAMSLRDDLTRHAKMLDANPPRWHGKPLHDPRYVSEYRRTPGPHSFLRFMTDLASDELKTYVRACLQWADANPGVWHPPWIKAVRAQIAVAKSKGS